MTGTEVALLAVSLGSALAARYLKPSTPSSSPRDNKPTSLSLRGETFAPIVVGRRRVPANFAWAGDRKSKKGRSEGKGGGGGGGGSRTYYEAAWHPICVGPIDSLVSVYIDGKIVLDETFDLHRISTESGMNVSLGKSGNFDLYWGEPDQPVSAFLADSTRVGIASRWPKLCYVVWKSKKLSSSPHWPQIDYEVVRYPCAPLTNSNAWIQTTDIEGANPAHALLELLMAPFPHGCGIDRSLLDLGSFEEVGVLCEQEFIAANAVAANGVEAAEFLAQMLQEHSIFLVQVEKKLALYAIRKLGATLTTTSASATSTTSTFSSGSATDDIYKDHILRIDGGTGVGQLRQITAYNGTTKQATVSPPWETNPGAGVDVSVLPIPFLGDDFFTADLPEQTRQLVERKVDRIVYLFDDILENYRTGDVPIDSDSRLLSSRSAKTTQRSLTTVTNRKVAERAARRLYATDLVSRTIYNLKGLRGARRLIPGSAFVKNFGTDAVPDMQILRVMSIEQKANEPAEISAVLDIYSDDAVSYLSDPPPIGPPSPVAGIDFAFQPAEIPVEVGSDGVIVARIRSSPTSGSAEINMSVSGTSYTALGTQDQAAAGGLLGEDLPADYAAFSDEGFVFVPVTGSEDEEEFSDTLDPTFWTNGNRMCLIGEELCFFDRLQQIDATTWRVRGLIRNVYDSSSVGHAAGTPVYFFNRIDQSVFTHQTLAAGVVSSWKSVPDGQDIGAVSAKNLTIRKRAQCPKPPDNFLATSSTAYTSTTPTSPVGRTRERVNGFISGEAISFTWNFRSSTGAGKSPYGTAVASENGDSTGGFSLEILSSLGVVLRTFTIAAQVGTSLVTQSYSSANRVTDFGVEPTSFTARLYAVNGAFRSLPIDIVVRKLN